MRIYKEFSLEPIPIKGKERKGVNYLAVSTDYVIEVLSEIEELIELIYSPYGPGAYKSDAKKAARRLKAQLEIGQKLD